MPAASVFPEGQERLRWAVSRPGKTATGCPQPVSTTGETCVLPVCGLARRRFGFGESYSSAADSVIAEARQHAAGPRDDRARCAPAGVNGVMHNTGMNTSLGAGAPRA